MLTITSRGCMVLSSLHFEEVTLPHNGSPKKTNRIPSLTRRCSPCRARYHDELLTMAFSAPPRRTKGDKGVPFLDGGSGAHTFVVSERSRLRKTGEQFSFHRFTRIEEEIRLETNSSRGMNLNFFAHARRRVFFTLFEHD